MYSAIALGLGLGGFQKGPRQVLVLLWAAVFVPEVRCVDLWRELCQRVKLNLRMVPCGFRN